MRKYEADFDGTTLCALIYDSPEGGMTLQISLTDESGGKGSIVHLSRHDTKDYRVVESAMKKVFPCVEWR